MYDPSGLCAENKGNGSWKTPKGKRYKVCAVCGGSLNNFKGSSHVNEKVNGKTTKVYYHDYSKQANAMLWRNGQRAKASYDRYIKDGASLIHIPIIGALNANKAKLLQVGWFYNHVKPHGTIDMKDKKRWKVEMGNAKYLPKGKFIEDGDDEPAFIVYGTKMSNADLGNVAFGYCGIWAGFTGKFLHFGAGVAQLSKDKFIGVFKGEFTPPKWGDQKDDYRFTTMGMNWAKSVKK